MSQEIEVRPGIVSKDSEGKLQCRAIFSRIVSLFAEQNDLQFAVPGGLIGRLFRCVNCFQLMTSHKFWKLFVQLVNLLLGVGTKIDPTLCRADRMVGQVCIRFVI